mmetsp:Transcript_132595/g.343144  ORF Transcript_132595/g.343144 Transcript_132595/m.343144 type:complete len:789 (+) Transcript_132595:86-2452(+)
MTVVDDIKSVGWLKSKYAVEGALGRGAFGDVLRVRKLDDGSYCACKRVLLGPLNGDMRQRALQEARLLKKLSSPYIVQYLDSFLEDRELYIIMELCDAGCLADLIKDRANEGVTIADVRAHTPGLAQEDLCRIAAQVLLGLDYLHDSRVLHRDIKPANIFLLKSGRALLGDLGVAKELLMDKEQAQTVVGSPAYLAPEIVEAQPYGTGSDMWSFGCVVYEMCYLRRPFEAHNQPALFVKILQCRLQLGPPGYSADVRSVFGRCLRRLPHKRPSAKDLLRTPVMYAATSGLDSSVAPEVTLLPNSLSAKYQHSNRRMSAPGECEPPRACCSHARQGNVDDWSCRATPRIGTSNYARRASSPATYGSLTSSAARAAALGGNMARTRAGGGAGIDINGANKSAKHELGVSPSCSGGVHNAVRCLSRQNDVPSHSGNSVRNCSRSESKFAGPEAVICAPPRRPSGEHGGRDEVGSTAIAAGARCGSMLHAGDTAGSPSPPCCLTATTTSCAICWEDGVLERGTRNKVDFVSSYLGVSAQIASEWGASHVEALHDEVDSKGLGMDGEATFALSDSIADSLACSTLSQASTNFRLSTQFPVLASEDSGAQIATGVSPCGRIAVPCRWPVSNTANELAGSECNAIASHFPEVMCSLRKSRHEQTCISQAQVYAPVDHDASMCRRSSMADVLGFLNDDSVVRRETQECEEMVRLECNELGVAIGTANFACVELRGDSTESCHSAFGSGASLASVLHSLCCSDVAGAALSDPRGDRATLDSSKAPAVLEEIFLHSSG